MEKLFFTYFIQDELGNIKIGKSFTPEKRFQEFQVGNASKLTLLLYIIGNSEKELHQKFKSFRIRGEWFKQNEELLEYIESVKPYYKKAKEIRYDYQLQRENERLAMEYTKIKQLKDQEKRFKQNQEVKDRKIRYLEQKIESLN